MNKDKLRWILGDLIRSVGLSERTRDLYIALARKFVKRLPSECVEAAWVRRSTANEDFFPLVSDIDVTILVNDNELNGLRKSDLRRSGLMQDVQFLSRRFLDAWMETGGFRNYQIPQWKQIYGIPVTLHPPVSANEELAFELAYEVHLVFKQIALKIAQKEFDPTDENKDIKKLSLELHRLKIFWETRDRKWITCKRDEIPAIGGLPEVYAMVERFCDSLIEQLEPPLNVYDWTRAVTGEDDLSFKTAISFKGVPIFVLRKSENILKACEKNSGHFFAPGSYLRMIKGIGIQEQAQLNRLASENSYYRKFSCQRLANDLVGAIVLEPDHIEQLYFCFFNIAHFYQSQTGKFPTNWHEIESSWKSLKRLPWENDDLERECVSYLDHLAALI